MPLTMSVRVFSKTIFLICGVVVGGGFGSFEGCDGLVDRMDRGEDG